MGEKATVLVVDGERRWVDAWAQVLDGEFDVRTATGVAAADRVLDQERVQAVLCDQRMPEMSGLDYLVHPGPGALARSRAHVGRRRCRHPGPRCRHSSGGAVPVYPPSPALRRPCC